MKILKVKVKPGARTEALTQLADGSWQASVKAPPVDGKANAALVALIQTISSVAAAISSVSLTMIRSSSAAAGSIPFSNCALPSKHITEDHRELPEKRPGPGPN